MNLYLVWTARRTLMHEYEVGTTRSVYQGGDVADVVQDHVNMLSDPTINIEGDSSGSFDLAVDAANCSY